MKFPINYEEVLCNESVIGMNERTINISKLSIDFINESYMTGLTTNLIIYPIDKETFIQNVNQDNPYMIELFEEIRNLSQEAFVEGIKARLGLVAVSKSMKGAIQ